MKNTKLFQKFAFIAAILIAQTAFSQMLPAPRQEKLLNGLKILMWSDKNADKVSVKIRIHSGSAFDPQGREGVMFYTRQKVTTTWWFKYGEGDIWHKEK